MSETALGLRGAGICLLVFGIIFAIKPKWFGKWEDKSKNLMQKRMTQTAYYNYMKKVGVASAVIGVVMIVSAYIMK